MPKICLDAGHFANYGPNYNVSPTYWESHMAWKLHLLLRDELKAYGFEVWTTRSDESKDMGLEARGRYSKGCDLFISLHSNACDTESVDRPVVIYPVDNRCMDLAEKLAKTVKATMQTNDPARIYNRWNSAHNADYYGVIRGAVSVGTPGLIIEHSFHTNDRAAKWLLSDANLAKLAKAEARVLAEHFGMMLDNPFTDVPDGKWYTDAVLRCYQRGIMQGTAADKFSPNAAVTRAQLAVVADKIIENMEKGGG